MNKISKVMIILFVFAASIVFITQIIPKKTNNNTNVKYTVIKDGYSSYQSRIISTYEEFQKLHKQINFNSSKYNQKYFENKSLAIINVITGSGMNKLESINISINGKLLTCKVNIKRSEGITSDDINGKVLLVEIDKQVTDFKIEY